MLIIFEGIDLSGKTSLINAIKEELKDDEIYFFKQPSPNGILKKEIESILKTKTTNNTDKLKYLFTIDRLYQWCEEIKPLLDNNKTVILDRFIFSSLVYNIDWNKDSNLKEINMKLYNNIKNKKTIFIDCNPEIAITRINQRNGDIHCFEKSQYVLNKARKRYLKLFEELEYNNILTFENNNEEDKERNIQDIINLIK